MPLYNLITDLINLLICHGNGDSFLLTKIELDKEVETRLSQRLYRWFHGVSEHFPRKTKAYQRLNHKHNYLYLKFVNRL